MQAIAEGTALFTYVMKILPLFNYADIMLEYIT